MTYTIANHNSSTFSKEETEYPAFDRNGEYCGQIYKVAAWAVPSGIHAEMELPSHLDLYMTNVGQWAPTFEIAEHYLAHRTTNRVPSQRRKLRLICTR